LGKDSPELDALPKVLIATSYYDNIRPLFFKTFHNLTAGAGMVFQVELFAGQTSAVDMFRNHAIEKGLAGGFDYVMFVDSDMSFPPHTTLGLLSTFELEADEKVYIAAGVYNIRRTGYVNAVYRWTGDAFDDINGTKDPDFAMDSIYVADAAGTGCMMIDLSLFDDKASELEYPWFQYWYKPMTPGGKPMRWSEDLVFGCKCSQIGVHTFVNTSIVCGHEVRGVQVYQQDASTFAMKFDDDLTVTKDNGEE